MFRRLKALHPTFSLAELNREEAKWCRNEYAMSKHGTTGIKPMELFEEQEKPLLRSLPSERLYVPVYRPAKVHSDRFFTYE